jgi:hypothetical protein
MAVHQLTEGIAVAVAGAQHQRVVIVPARDIGS